MSRNSAGTLIQFIGSPLEDVVARNGTNGYRWRNSAEAICNAIGAADPRIIFADIQGAMAHMSSADKDDPKEVITVQLQAKSGTRVGSVHLHVDGTWRFFPTRVGQWSKYAANIQKANLPGLHEAMRFMIISLRLALVTATRDQIPKEKDQQEQLELVVSAC